MEKLRRLYHWLRIQPDPTEKKYLQTEKKKILEENFFIFLCISPRKQSKNNFCKHKKTKKIGVVMNSLRPVQNPTVMLGREITALPSSSVTK
jgi:hypothetical protein